MILATTLCLMGLGLDAGTGTSRDAAAPFAAAPEHLLSVRTTGDDGWAASNPMQALRASFDAASVTVRNERGGVELRLAAFGRDGRLSEPGPARVSLDGPRIEYDRGPIVEWYVNDERGLEQGFTVRERPAGAGELIVGLEVGGGLRAEVLPGARDARFVDGEGRTVLHYHGLLAWDATGADLDAELAMDGGGLRIRVDDAGAEYPLTIDPVVATELARITAIDGDQNDFFGTAVAIDGDTAVVGASGDDHAAGADAGSAYVYGRNQGGADAWGLVTTLRASDASADDLFGTSVAIDADTIVVGAVGVAYIGIGVSGAAYVFERDLGGPDNWGERTRVSASARGYLDAFGVSVDVSGDTVVVGARADDHAAGVSAGSAHVYERDLGGPDNWGLVTRLTASNGDFVDYFGHTVGIDGDTIVVSTSNSNQSYVFERDLGGPDAWGEHLILPFEGEASISGDTIVIGAEAGGLATAKVYERDLGGPGAWGEAATLSASDEEVDDLFGDGTSISGDWILVGARRADHPGGGGSDNGAAYVFARDEGGPGSWGEVAILRASDTAPGDQLGEAVAIDAGTAFVGAPFTDHSGATGIGTAYVFQDPWFVGFGNPVVYCTAGTTAAGCAASISATGTPSATAGSGFDLQIAGADAQRNGLIFYGVSGRLANTWGFGAMASSSFLCVKGPRQRTPAGVTTGAVGTCTGTFSVDWNAYVSANPSAIGAPYTSGDVVNAQFWFRDPLSPNTTHLSDAIEFCVEP